MTCAPSLRARIAGRIGRLLLDVDVDTSPGTLVIAGPNGSGKTSFLLFVLGVLAADRGRVEVGSDVLLDTDIGVNVPLEARRLGYVPQDYALFPHLTVRENVEFAIESARPELSRAERGDRANTWLAELDLELLGKRRAGTLSGGEKQRVALARALSVEPRALLLDEPLAALDVHARRDVREFLASYLAKIALPTLVVTHDALDARALGHRVAVLEAGGITQTGTLAELESRPASRFVEEFVGSAAGANRKLSL